MSSSLAWSAAALPRRDRFAKFREAVSATHLPWDIPARSSRTDYRARLRAHQEGALRVVECECDPCDGRRGVHELGRSEGAWFGILHIVEGTERIRQGGREIHAGPGDLVLWDSTRPIEFAIGHRLHKVTLLLPHRAVEAVVASPHDRVCAVVPGSGGPGALFASHLRMLAKTAMDLPPSLHGGLESATLDLLSILWRGAAPGLRDDDRARARDHILCRLGDPLLTPASVARGLGLSLRSLHRLFEDSGSTPARWIWDQRLERCRADLRTHLHQSVSEIAFRWGFNDAAHFSRAFRLRYGMSPRQWRHGA